MHTFMYASSFSLLNVVHSFQNYSVLPSSDCIMFVKNNIKTKIKQMKKMNALAFCSKTKAKDCIWSLNSGVAMSVLTISRDGQ